MIRSTLCLLGLLLFTGCPSSETSSSGGFYEATSPQEKAHQDQLDGMGREDAAGVEDEGEEAADEPSRPIMRNRRQGQRVIDQPIRRTPTGH